jgi:predicted ATPase
MLEFVRIQRFKTLLDATFELGPLNLFSGLNGMGKSSLLQALLLLRQSFERNTLFRKGLLLKGDYVSLGAGRDVLAERAESNSIEFLLTWPETGPVHFSFDYRADSDLQPALSPPEIPEPEILSLFNQNFQYLSAERVGPKTFYETSEYHIRDLNSLGNYGEYTAHFIAENGRKPLSIEALRHPGASSASLLENLDHWMSELSPGLRVHATLQAPLNSVSLTYAFEQGKETTADFTPQNVGFGLTYVLPVVTAILRAKPGDLVLMENPESHLHPAGQTVVGRLCAIAATRGVQLFVESHSDHFLNGVRVAVKKGDLSPEDARLFFLERDPAGVAHETRVISPEIDAEGRIDLWPDGFFDEWDRQLEKLL